MAEHKVRRLKQGDTNSPTLPPWKWTPKIGVPIGRLQNAYESIIETTDAYAAKRVEIARQVANDKRLSDFAKQEKITATAKTDFMIPLRRARHEIARARAEIEHKRANLKPRTPDPLDFAGALLRQELRAHLYEMGGSKAAAFLAATKDPRYLEATLTAPVELTGIHPDTYKLLEEQYVRTQFPDQAAAIDEAEQALEAATRTLETAEGATLNELGREARTWMAEVAAEIDPVEQQKTDTERANMKALGQPLPTRDEIREMAKRLPLKEREELRSEIWDDTSKAVLEGYDKAFAALKEA